MYYLDTSALVKRYYTEKGSEWIHTLFAPQHVLVTSKIAYAELLAALARKLRAKEIKADDFTQAVDSFQKEWKECVVIEVSDAILADVLALVRRHPLRGFDAIHLCSALWFRKRIKKEIGFVCADRHLLEAATAEGFVASDPERSEESE